MNITLDKWLHFKHFLTAKLYKGHGEALLLEKKHEYCMRMTIQISCHKKTCLNERTTPCMYEPPSALFGSNQSHV